VLLQVARLDYLKDHVTALRTLQRVVAQHPQARLVLVGDGPERPRIEKETRRLGLIEQVLFLGQRSDVPRLLAMADFFLLTSISEGIPLTLIEAMNAGLPVVSTRVGGVGEIVQQGITGLLASSGDDQALAAHVVQLVADAPLRRRMAEAGRVRARALFSEQQMHVGYLDLYEEMLHA
jgi:glycosyltransferase involved in cell wall biosynthesis